jgi:TolA-binding protein
VLLLVASRGLVYIPEDREPLAQVLYERASRAYAEGRHGDAAEYLQHAIRRSQDPDLRAEMSCLRGESLLQGGRPAEAVPEFERALQELPDGPHAAQALFGLGEAQERSGRGPEAADTRDRLRRCSRRPPGPHVLRNRLDVGGRAH